MQALNRFTGGPSAATLQARKDCLEAIARAEAAESRVREADRIVARILEYSNGANPPSPETLNITFLCQNWQRKAVRS